MTCVAFRIEGFSLAYSRHSLAPARPTRIRADDAQPFRNPVREGSPMIRQLTVIFCLDMRSAIQHPKSCTGHKGTRIESG